MRPLRNRQRDPSSTESRSDPEQGSDPEKGLLRSPAEDSEGGARPRGVPFSRFSTWESIIPDRPRMPQWLVWLRDVFFGSYDRHTDVPSYRTAPMISGSLVPFSILLQIPGITERWYVRTEGTQVVERRPNSTFLNVVLAISFGCAVIANVALLVRFFERRIATMTVIAIVCLVIHDLINLLVVIIFGVEHRFNDGFTYGEAYWLTVCSTVVSLITVGTLIWDMWKTANFAKSGSGLTRKQRSLIIITIIFLTYTALSALISSLMMHLTFIDGLYFTIVTNLTIGFGDIVPDTPVTRSITSLLAAFGIVILGSAVRLIGSAVIESLEIGYRLRVREYRRRRRERQKEVREAARWRDACETRLSAKGVPVWVPAGTHAIEGLPVEMSSEHPAAHARRAPRPSDGASSPPPPEQPHPPPPEGDMVLNLAALSGAELGDAARAAQVPLARYLSKPVQLQVANARAGRSSLGGAMREGSQASIIPGEPMKEKGAAKSSWMSAPRSSVWWARTYHWLLAAKGSEASTSAHLGKAYVDTVKALEVEERRSLYLKLGLAWANLIVFWFSGAAIFSHVEQWPFAQGIYFCFVAFATIGYGDVHPLTALGRSIFIFWALIGVGSMTVLIAVISDAFSSKYRSVMHSKTFDQAIKNYRNSHTARHGNGRGRGRSASHKIDPTLKSNIERLASPGPQDEKEENGRAGETRSAPAGEKDGAQRHTRWASSPTSSNPPSPTSSPTRTPTLAEVNGQMRQRFEALPPLVLEEIHLLREQMRFFLSASGHAHGWSEAAGETGLKYSSGGSDVPDSLRRLLDEVTKSGDKADRMKDEIWDDEYARNTLFVLGFEKSIRKLLDAAEGALEVLAERDRLVAEQQSIRQDGLRLRSPGAASRSQSRASKAPRTPTGRSTAMRADPSRTQQVDTSSMEAQMSWPTGGGSQSTSLERQSGETQAQAERLGLPLSGSQYDVVLKAIGGEPKTGST